MSKPCFHRPAEVTIEPARFEPPQHAPCTFVVHLRYRPDSDWQHFMPVHIPPSAQRAFVEGRVRGFHLEALELNGVPARKLEAQPAFVVLGVELTDGTRVSCVPRVLGETRRARFAAAAAIAAVGASLFATPLAWFGGAIAGLSTHLVRTALRIPTRPFWPPPSA